MYRTPAIVNGEKFLFCPKRWGIQLFEAEFNVDLFVLAELDTLDEADQKLPADAGTVHEPLNQSPRFILHLGGGFFLFFESLQLFLQLGAVCFDLQVDPLEVGLSMYILSRFAVMVSIRVRRD